MHYRYSQDQIDDVAYSCVGDGMTTCPTHLPREVQDRASVRMAEIIADRAKRKTTPARSEATRKGCRRCGGDGVVRHMNVEGGRCFLCGTYPTR